MKTKSIRVIFDTNIWISFLIGKKLAFLKEHIANGDIKIIITSELIIEIENVTSRPRIKKYFPKQAIKELLDLLAIIGENIAITPTHYVCKDPKDNFLLDLIHFSKANYLVTGDKFLLELNPFKTAQMIKASEFENVLKEIGL